MIHIDGSFGEGGGQIIRSSLALSLITGKDFRVDKIRAGRENPGLQNQHLMSLNAAATIGNAEVAGAKKGSREFTFRPGKISPGRYDFRIGTAGSTGLVFQTVLPPLLVAGGNSHVTIEGGTHNPWAPPFDFLEHTFIPLINTTGAKVIPHLERFGFYPGGGGVVSFEINSVERLGSLVLLERDSLPRLSAECYVVKLPVDIAHREAKILRTRIESLQSDDAIKIFQPENCSGVGNFVAVYAQSSNLCETVTSIGAKGIRAEEVANAAASEMTAYLSNGAPVGEHLADQLLIPMALAGSGQYKTGPLSLHTKTNITIIQKFLDVHFTTEELGDGTVIVSVEH